MPKPSEWLAASPAPSEPIVVYTGPTRSGAALVAAVAADSDSQGKGRRGKHARVAAKKPDAVASEAKPTDARPARPVRHASAKPDAAKPTAAPAKPAPRTAAKPKPNKPAG
jgi:D-alanyl-D-alanine carboxypeptidase